MIHIVNSECPMPPAPFKPAHRADRLGFEVNPRVRFISDHNMFRSHLVVVFNRRANLYYVLKCRVNLSDGHAGGVRHRRSYVGRNVRRATLLKLITATLKEFAP